MGAREANPYVGLRPFEADDTHLFFGRSAQTTELLEALHRHRFLGVVGSSGCGKSSLIKAGLVSALRGGFLIEDREQWSIARLTPGDSPLENLAGALAEALGGSFDTAGLRQEIQLDGIESVCDRLLRSMTPETNLLVIVDQFEEIFAFRGRMDAGEDGLDGEARRRRFQRRAEAADFVSVLLALTKRRGAPIYVVFTMRSDFLGDCDIFYGLPESMNQGRYLVPRLTPKQLEEAIAGPAKFSGAEISKPLLDRLRNELGDRFDRLPVLQHALLRTWEKWSEKGGAGAIDIVHYEDAGTLEGALGIHAGLLLDGLSKDLVPAGAAAEDAKRKEELERTVAGVFQSLTDTDAANRQVRRPARLSRIAEENGLTRERVKLILKPFLDAGFVYATVEQEAGEEDDTRYSLSHESLIRQWDKLKGWVAE
jgi:energy-coupling factor transporter ATP-binding protein EcfA2